MVEDKFIMKIQGREFIKFEGLLDEFHKHGGKTIETKMLNLEPFIMQATVSGEKGTYQGIGDANETNVNKMIQPHRIRMAETRAIARALRWYNNIGMCSAEELGGDVIQEESVSKQPTKPTAAIPTTIGKYTCSFCGDEIAKIVNDYSVKTFKKPLCRQCQSDAREMKENANVPHPNEYGDNP